MKKVVYIFAAMLTSSFAIAQEEEVSVSPATTFAGSADAYYKYDFAKQMNGLTSFTNSQDSFELGMASIEASHTFGKASVFVDLGFGKRAGEFSYNETTDKDINAKFLIKQLYFTYQISEEFKVVAGSFGTHIGYELVDAVDNKNYSMSYAFSYGPFFNTGIKAQYTSGKFTAMLGITNPTDFKSAMDAGTKQKTYVGQIGYVGETGSAYLNFTTGSGNPAFDDNKTQFDFVASKTITDAFSLGFNATYAKTKNDFDSELDGDWFSVIGYASYAFKPSLSLAYRAEYFDGKDAIGLGTLDGSSVFANTISLNYKVGKLTIIPELRYDAASEDIFLDTDSAPAGGSFFGLLATTYSF
ncbi:outer membrane beta-barrel protein [Flavobacterium sp. Fl-77]|uniref:Outer membrane beta-barrel protein n=1 Tax=Flavobacterium flavipigmentatum TaxID=2893884 RepID=A0AAJ2VXW1_9FLAO|nr:MULTISPECIES: outer membrane beta-barrel protein [unclassified Flavobacterium]MDX6183344.1 outer membrane beta-barrel protein [Flavobacterium sp. Fl-33]MDX6186628.1 outer membrane beta-barrel protein [Flavobacterium sp. Fl-77]UFH38603.1 porin [Flavobacterium sp. F-70]